MPPQRDFHTPKLGLASNGNLSKMQSSLISKKMNAGSNTEALKLKYFRMQYLFWEHDF